MKDDMTKMTEEQLLVLAGPLKDIPEGYCQCGCGQKTNKIKNTIHARGRIAGKYSAFI